VTSAVDQDLALVRKVLELSALGGTEHLMPRFDDLFHPDFVWTSALVGSVEGNTFRGREELASFWRDFDETVGPAEFTEVSMEVVAPGTVLVVCQMLVRGQGSGVPVGGEWGFVFRLRDGRVTTASSHRSHADAEEAAATTQAPATGDRRPATNA
jgi:ketosteroid isomerase-like protein